MTSGLFVAPAAGVGTNALDARMALFGAMGGLANYTLWGGGITQSAVNMNFTIGTAVYSVLDPITTRSAFVSSYNGGILTPAAGPGSGSRKDIIVVKHNNVENGDASSLVSVSLVAGMAGSPGVEPATPTGSYKIAVITVPTSAATASACTLTLVNAGTINPPVMRFATKAQMDAAGPWNISPPVGMQACVYADTTFKNGEYTWNGTIFAKNMAVGGLVPVSPTFVSGTGVSLSATGTILVSASAAINMDGVFTSDYDDYRVVITGNTSAAANVTGFMRASGANITGAVYGYQYMQGVGTASTASNSTGATNWPFHTGTTGEISVILELHTPASASRNTRGESTANAYTGGVQTLSHFAVRRGATAAEDGMSVNVSAGTFTGEIKIFAYSH